MKIDDILSDEIVDINFLSTDQTKSESFDDSLNERLNNSDDEIFCDSANNKYSGSLDNLNISEDLSGSDFFSDSENENSTLNYDNVYDCKLQEQNSISESIWQ